MLLADTQSDIETITPANLLKFYMRPVYEAQYHFRVHERTLKIKMKEFKMHFKNFFADIPSNDTKLSEDEIRIYDGKPIWEAVYHLQVPESILRSRVKTFKLDLWRCTSASTSTSTFESSFASAYAYANLKDLLQSLVEAKGWNYGIVWDLNGSCLIWNTGCIVKEQSELMAMPSDLLLEELSLEDSLNGRRMNVFLKLSGLLSGENIQQDNQSITDIQWFYLLSMSESVSVSESLASRMLRGEAFLLSQMNNLFHSGWEHAQDAASFGLKTLILIPFENQVIELGSKDVISEATLEYSIKSAKAFYDTPVSGRKLKRKAEDEQDLEFEIEHDGKMSVISVSKEGISFEKLQQSVAQALTLQRSMFSLQFLDEDSNVWLTLKNDHNLKTCMKILRDRVKARRRTKSNMSRQV